MSKLATALSGAVLAIGFAVIASPTAQADDPFIPCPYNPSVPGAQMEYFNQKTAELRAMQADVNNRVLGPMSGPEAAAWVEGPEGLASLERQRQIVWERDHPPLACTPLRAPLPAPYFDPTLPDPGPTGPPVIGNDVQPTQSEHSCADLNNAWQQAGMLPNGADLLLAIRKLPGFGTVQAAQLAGCSIGQAISGNQHDADVGMCNGVAALNPVPFAPNPCPQR